MQRNLFERRRIWYDNMSINRGRPPPVSSPLTFAQEVKMIRRILLGVVLLGVAGVASADEPEEDNKALCQKFYDEVVNKGNIDVIDEMIADDFVEHDAFPGLEPGREGVKQFFTMMQTAFPDLKFEVDFMLSDGDMVAVYLTMSGTQKGEFMGMPASGKEFNTKTVDFLRIVDGKAVEHWGVMDGMTMMHQLGVTPPESPDKE